MSARTSSPACVCLWLLENGICDYSCLSGVRLNILYPQSSETNEPRLRSNRSWQIFLNNVYLSTVTFTSLRMLPLAHDSTARSLTASLQLAFVLLFWKFCTTFASNLSSSSGRNKRKNEGCEIRNKQKLFQRFYTRTGMKARKHF